MDDVLVYFFFKDECQRVVWICFVKFIRVDWIGLLQYIVIYSEYFNEECYEWQYFFMKDFGIFMKK